MPSSFDNTKDLLFQITLGTGSFGSSSANQISLQGFRATCEVDKAGGVQMNTLRAAIYGVSVDHMNSLTSLQWQPGTLSRNQIQVFAIDGSQQTLIFSGNVGNCWANYTQMPEVFLEIQAFAGLINQLTPVPPSSYQGTVDVATTMSQIVNLMNSTGGTQYTFENNLIQPITLRNPYLPGAAWDQALSLAHQAGIDIYLDDNVFAICTSLNPRNTPGQIPQISATSGLVGYPTFGSDSRGPSINLTTLFNPAVVFGGQVSVVTNIQPAITNALTTLPPAQRADGIWIVNSIGHSLSSQKPDGPWFSRLSCGKTRVITST